VTEDWPSPKHPDDRQPLPRVEDLPRGEGYEAEAVAEAFDAFYRHVAQLDSTLRTLEAVDAFSRQASELRADLRSIRVAGWSPYPRGYPVAAPQSLGAGLPDALPRIALEVAFLIVVTVVVAISNLATWEIVAVMAAAFVLTALAELIAGRERAPVARPTVAAEPPPVLDEPAPKAVALLAPPPSTPARDDDGAEAVGWAAFAEPSGPEALTVMGAVTFDEPEAEAPLEPVEEPGPQPERLAEPEPEAVAEPAQEDIAEPAPEDVAEPEPEPSETTAELDAAEVAAEPEKVEEPQPEPELVAEEAPAEPEPELEPVAMAEGEPASPAEAEPEPELGHRRRFWRRAHEPEPEPEAVVEAAEPEPVAEAEPEPEAETEPAPAFVEEPVLIEEHTETGPKRRWAWRRRLREPVPAPERATEESEPPKHVRVLPPPEPVLERDLDPWERGFDFDLEPEDLGEESADTEDELPLRRPPR
jgi:hypothetical protein